MNKKVRLRIIGAVLLLLIVATITSFAYFTANLSGSETETSLAITGGTMYMNFQGGNRINVINIYPREEAWLTKTFTVAGTSTVNLDMIYNLVLVIQENSFSDGALKYKLTSNNIDDNGATSPSNIKLQDIQNGTLNYHLGNAKFNGPTEGPQVHSYQLEIYFPNQDFNQNHDQGKYMAGYVSIDNGIDTYPYANQSDFRYKDLGNNTSSIVEYLGTKEIVSVPEYDDEGRKIISITGSFYNEEGEPLEENSGTDTYKGAFQEKQISVIQVNTEEEFLIGTSSFNKAFIESDSVGILLNTLDLTLESNSFSNDLTPEELLDYTPAQNVDLVINGEDITIDENSFKETFPGTEKTLIKIDSNNLDILDEAFYYFAHDTFEKEELNSHIKFNLNANNTIDIGISAFEYAFSSYAENDLSINSKIDFKITSKTLNVQEEAFYSAFSNETDLILTSTSAVDFNILAENVVVEAYAFQSAFEKYVEGSIISNLDLNFNIEGNDLLLGKSSFDYLFTNDLGWESNGDIESTWNVDFNIFANNIDIESRTFDCAFGNFSKINILDERNINLNIVGTEISIGRLAFSNLLSNLDYSGSDGLTDSTSLININIISTELSIGEDAFNTIHANYGKRLSNNSEIELNIKAENINIGKDAFSRAFTNSGDLDVFDERNINLNIHGTELSIGERAFAWAFTNNSRYASITNNQKSEFNIISEKIDIGRYAFDSVFQDISDEELIIETDINLKIDATQSLALDEYAFFRIFFKRGDALQNTSNNQFEIITPNFKIAPNTFYETMGDDIENSREIIGDSIIKINNNDFLKSSDGAPFELNIPNTVTEIGYNAFGRTNIKKIIIPANVVLLPYRYSDDYDIFGINDKGKVRLIYNDNLEAAGTYIYSDPVLPETEGTWSKN